MIVLTIAKCREISYTVRSLVLGLVVYCYVLISEDVSQSDVDRCSEDSYKIKEGVWAVLSRLGTCADLCEELGMNGETSGVVVKFATYYGLFNPALWEKLDLWRSM